MADAQEETWGQKTLCHSEQGPDWCSRSVWNQSEACNPQSVFSWREQRRFGLEYPVAALGSHPLAAMVNDELAALERGQVAAPDVSGLSVASDLSAVPCGATTFGFGADGSLQSVGGKDVGTLFRFEYQSYSQDDIDAIVTACASTVVAAPSPCRFDSQG